MKQSNETYITFGVQAGDKQGNDIVSPFYLKLRKNLAEKCSNGYGNGLKELAFILRIDGALWHWDKSGCSNLRANKKGEASVDIYMPVDIWKPGDKERIKHFLITETKNGFYMMIDKLTKLNISFNAELLIQDFNQAMDSFNNTND